MSGRPRGAMGWRWISLGAAALALASKSIVMGLPLVLLILDVYPLGAARPPRPGLVERPSRGRLWREKIPFALLAVGAGAAAYLVQRSTGYLTPADPVARIGDGRVQRVVPRLEDGGAAQPGPHLRAARRA